MAEMTGYAPGTPSWVDLATSDPAGAREFYTGLFGWDAEVGPDEYGNYTMFLLRGRVAAGMAGQPAREGVPTAWTTYIATDDTATVAKRIPELGGTLLQGPMEIPGQGVMTWSTDPAGAAFGTWEARGHEGAALVNEPGAISWNELTTRDLAGAMPFYTGLFGWGWDPVDTGEGGPEYQTFSVEGRAVGGALQMTEEFGDTAPHWMPYFGVADTDAAAERAAGLGATVGVPPTDSPFGRFAVLVDPQGAVLTVMQMPAD